MSLLGTNEFVKDDYNQRVVGYLMDASPKDIIYINELENTGKYSKIIIYTLKDYKQLFEDKGFFEEGNMNGFFRGETVYILSKFLDIPRATSVNVSKEDEILTIVENDDRDIQNNVLSDSFTLGYADSKDAEELAALYSKVFKYYPSQVDNPDYLEENIGDNYFFVYIKKDNKIISAASAMIMPEFSWAEITDCVTDPEFRGNQLLIHIIKEIEKKLLDKNIFSHFSIARSESVGMNMSLKRLGYEYQGRLINNCKIYSGFEDMNLWTKQTNNSN